MSTAVARPDPADRLRRQVERLGVAGVAGLGLVGALLVWASLTGETAWLGLVVPALALGGVALATVRPSPALAYAAVMGGSVVLLLGDRGVAVVEVLFGLGAMAYLGLWATRAVAEGAGVVRSSTDLAAALWCVLGIAGGAALGVVFGADPYDFRADLQAALFFPFYFPAKEVVRRTSRGPEVAATVLVGLGAVAAVVAVVTLRGQLAAATEVYEIVDVRVTGGMYQIAAAILIGAALVATTASRTLRLVLLGVLAALLVGLIVGKSRAYWVAVALGLGIVGTLLRGSDRRRWLIAGGAVAVGVAGLAAVVVGDQLALIAAGALDRLTSLGMGGRDLSLAGRLAESAAVLEQIATNPVLGHGWGVQVTHYSVVSDGTRTWAFFHNGYLALWHKLGLWGLGLMLTIWLGTLARGGFTARVRTLTPVERGLLVGVVAALAVFVLTAITSNPFSIMDQMLLLAVLLGTAAGVIQREEDRRLRTR